ncbi:MAG: Membrane protein [uncultured Sulfurovum sp.]|uniref:Membrane protein n=1 Tax=uncultured Sulfurovum sp. TaxID=269237 RepID=A0A6S6SM19_9BACT|nr:MAG: Membrane protein [uncultured Sulfurovum sp.]
MSQLQFYAFYCFYAIALFYLAITLPIGTHEAVIYYTDDGILRTLTHLSKGWFSNGLDFRLPFLLFALLNIPLFFLMSRAYFHKVEDSYLATTIFALLPGIITSAILVNIAVLVITLVMVFLILNVKKLVWLQAVVAILLLYLHDASIIFFISLAIYSAFKRNSLLFTVSILLIAVSFLYFNRLHVGGHPSGEFLELFALYAALFSPLVFIYFFYALYRIWLRERKEILWYISFSSFSLSILLSLRQQVIMTDFAPYVIVAVVLMMLVYKRTVNVRLPQFQKTYRLGFNIVLGSLIFSALIILFHKPLFLLYEDKTKHFSYAFYEPYWQVMELKEIGQECYTVTQPKVQFQLKYHGIEACTKLGVPKIHR